MREIQEIDERYHEHPNQIHEVPVQAHNLEVVGIVTAALIAQAHCDESDYAAGDVGEMQTGNTEK